MTLDKVAPGQPFRPDAEDWNAFIDAARDFRARSSRPDLKELELSALGVIRVRNDSGAALPRCAAVGINQPFITPGTNLVGFQNQVTFGVVKPVAGTHEGRTAILLEPLAGPAMAGAPGAIGYAVL